MWKQCLRKTVDWKYIYFHTHTSLNIILHDKYIFNIVNVLNPMLLQCYILKILDENSPNNCQATDLYVKYFLSFK